MVQSAGPQVAEEAASEPQLERCFHLVLLDDNDHTYAYVVEMLGRIFGYGRGKAFAIATIVDGQGRAIVETAGYDQTLRHQRQIHAFGADPRLERSVGSMRAVLEEAP